MKRLILSTIILAASLTGITADKVSGADILWTHQFGTALEDKVTGMGVDNSGNVYVVGSTIGVLPSQVAMGDIDAYVSKYNSNGDLVWTRQFGTAMGDLANSVAVTGEGTVYAVGITGGTFPDQTNFGQHDSFLRKYDSAGNELWTRQFGTDNQDEPLRVNLDSAGNIYIVGRTASDAFITKYDSSGNLLWTRQFGTPDGTVAWDVLAKNEIDRVYVAGYTYGAFPGQTNLGYADAFLRAYDTAGNELWTRQFGTAHLDVAMGLALGTDGKIYVVGQLNGSFIAKFDVNGDKLWFRPFWGYSTRVAIDSAGNLLMTGSTRYGGIPGQIGVGGQDAFVTKCDAEANEIMSWQFGTGGTDSADDLAIGPNGTIYIAGSVNGGLLGQTHLGGTDPFVMALSTIPQAVQSLPAGVNWAVQLGTNSDEEVNAVGMDGAGNVYVAGRIYGEFPGYQNSILGGGWDAFVSKWSGDGKRRWTLQLGTGMGTNIRDIAVDQAGNQYVAGTTGGALPGQTNSGAPDAFLRKYDTNGNELWTRQFGSAAHDEAVSVKLDNTNNIFVVWYPSGIGGGRPSIHKYDNNGNLLWTRLLADNTEPAGFAIDAVGNFYLAGITDSALPGETFAGGLSDAYLRKYDSSGNESWTRQFGTSNEDHALAVEVDNKFNVYVAGRTMGSLPGKTFEGPPFDAFIRKYDNAGNELWTDEFGAVGDGFDEIRGISIDGIGNVYVAGASGPDALVRKYNSNGDVLWSRQLGGGFFADYARDATLTSDGKLLAAGFTYGSFLGQNYFGSQDAFFLKMDAFIPMDLRHVVLLLKLLVGIVPDGNIIQTDNIISYDFNKNNEIDLGDVIYILQKLAGSR